MARLLAAAREAIVASLCFAVLFVNGAAAQDFSTAAKQAILMDHATGAVLFAKNADELMVPASMAKVMTVAVLAREMREGRLDYDTLFTISQDAWRRGGAPSRGSTMFAELGSQVRLEDLLRGIIVHSGNDASIAAAEGVAGSEAGFARMMTAYARELGLERSTFMNATGFHDPDQLTTARELALLTRHLIEAEPEIYAMFGEESFAWNGITQRNRNPLLAMNIGADGVKTGFVGEAGHGLIGSAVFQGQRLILVVNGLESEAARATESRRLLEWGFRAFERRRLFAAGDVVGEAAVFGGERAYVPLVGAGPIEILNPRGSTERVTAKIVYRGPLRPPVAEGAPVGTLRVMRGETLALEAPLFAGASVEQGPLARRAADGLWELAAGAIRGALFGDE